MKSNLRLMISEKLFVPSPRPKEISKKWKFDKKRMAPPPQFPF